MSVSSVACPAGHCNTPPPMMTSRSSSRFAQWTILPAAAAAVTREVFGPQADNVPVTAPKSYFGNLGAGSAVVELIASVLALREGRLPPVLNYETADPECAINIARGAAGSPGRSFLNLSVTPQGQAAVLCVQVAP